MKELTIQQKAKAYDEAKARMSKAYNSNRCTIGFMNEIFPELKEPENEEVRGAIIHFISHTPTVPKGTIDKETMLAWLEKQKPSERNSDWSDEDERIRKALINGFNKLDKSAVWYNGITNGQIRAWLEKQGEQTPAWSEEDEERIKNILSVLDAQVCWDGATGKKGNPYQKEIDWLKSLKERCTWKPSDEQMAVLNEVINYAANSDLQHWSSFIYTLLKSLREQLKKLKG